MPTKAVFNQIYCVQLGRTSQRIGFDSQKRSAHAYNERNERYGLLGRSIYRRFATGFNSSSGEGKLVFYLFGITANYKLQLRN